MVRPRLNAAASARIEDAIAAAEKTSRAELVAMVAPRASDYRATGLSLAILGSFAIGLLGWAALPWASGGDVLLIELIAFPLLLAILELTPLGDRLTPRDVKTEAAQRLARAAFLEHGLAATPERNAVLFFVSLAEHHVEIIADGDLHQRVGAAGWQRIVDDFTARVRRGELEGGFVDAIGALATILAQHFPASGDRPNAVANRLILLS